MPKGVLTPEQIGALEKAQKALTDVIPMIGDAIYCDMDCSYQKQQVESLIEQIGRWRERFGDGQRPV